MYLAISEYRKRFAESFIAQEVKDIEDTLKVRKHVYRDFFFKPKVPDQGGADFDLAPELAGGVAALMNPIKDDLGVEMAVVQACIKMRMLLDSFLEEKVQSDMFFIDPGPREE